MLHILVIDHLAPAALGHLQEVGTVEYLPDSPEEDIFRRLLSSDVLVLRSGHRLTAAWLDRAPRLRAVIRAGVGMDNIPVTWLRQRGILVANMPTASTISVAEYAVGGILLLMRNFIPGYLGLTEGRWRKSELMGYELAGKTVGLIGYGNIGKGIARRLRSFDTAIVYHRRSGGGIDTTTGAQWRSLPDLCAESDVISVQVPLTDETFHLLDDQVFEMMGRAPYLVNVSRYDVLDMEALHRAVVRGRVRAALIDPVEPHQVDRRYFDGVPIYPMPHLGGSTFDAQERLGQAMRDQLIAWNLS